MVCIQINNSRYIEVGSYHLSDFDLVRNPYNGHRKSTNYSSEKGELFKYVEGQEWEVFWPKMEGILLGKEKKEEKFALLILTLLYLRCF